MDLTTAVPVVTGANRGLGRRLVDALLERGAGKVYALAREPGACATTHASCPWRSTSPTPSRSREPPLAPPTRRC